MTEQSSTIIEQIRSDLTDIIHDGTVGFGPDTDNAMAQLNALLEIAEAAALMSETLVELSLACEVYFDTDSELPDHDSIDGSLVHAYRDQNNYRDAAARLNPQEGTV